MNRVLRANARVEEGRESKLLQLAVNPLAIAAGHESQFVRVAEPLQQPLRTRKQARILLLVGVSPKSIRGAPELPGDFGRAIDAVPIGRVVPRQIAAAEVNA